MPSTKSRAKKPRNIQEPQRRNGKLRVAAILKAAAEIIAEQGYETAAMAQIAARSDTHIGSLYRFFPNKESIANALIARYRENVIALLDKIDTNSASLSLSVFADSLLTLLLELRRDGAAAASLIGAHKDWSAKREEFRASALKRIAETLRKFQPGLAAGLAQSMALVLLHNMKTMKTLSAVKDKNTRDDAIRDGAIKELSAMNRLYLQDRLKGN